MAKGKKDPKVLHRTVKFEIFPNAEHERALWHISRILTDQIWNPAVTELLNLHEQYRRPIYDEISSVKLAMESLGWPAIFSDKMRARKKFKKEECPEPFVHIRDYLFARLKVSYTEHSISLFDHINGLTERRARDATLAAIPRNWQEETLDTVHAGFKSFWKLRKKGDADARPPATRDSSFFGEIPGRSGFSVEGQNLILRFGKARSEPLVAGIPAYQIGKLREWLDTWNDTPGSITKKVDPDSKCKGLESWIMGWGGGRKDLIKKYPQLESEDIAHLLRWYAARRGNVNPIIKKFTLYREPRDGAKRGRWWISLACDLNKPPTKPMIESAVVFIVPGTTRLAILSPIGERLRESIRNQLSTAEAALREGENLGREVAQEYAKIRENLLRRLKASYELRLARPDFHWSPKITAVEERMKTCRKGSNARRRLAAARRKMFRLLHEQNKLRNRTLANQLMELGLHFVVADVPIRSKPGKLADAAKPERGGVLGLNWAVQNTGTMAALFDQLEQKVEEFGGWVERFQPTSRLPQQNDPEYKLKLVRRLRDDWLAARK